MNEEFKSVCDNEPSVLQILTKGINVKRLQNGEESRLLAYLDNIVDYYLNTNTLSESETIGPRFIMIDIPDAKPWARTLCEEYLFLKINLQHGNTFNEVPRLRNLDETSMGPDVFKKEFKKKRSIHNVKKKIRAIEQYKTIRYKSLFWLNEEDKKMLCSNPLIDDILLIHPEYLTNKIAVDYEDEYSIDVENLFLFPCNRKDNSSYYNSGSLSGWDHLKNCFVFIFGNNSYFLTALLDKADLWCETFVGKSHKEVADERIHDYIGLRKDERDYLFHENGRQMVHLLPRIDVGTEELIELYSNNLYTRDRNILSLCQDSESQSYYKEYLLQRSGGEIFKNEYLSFTFDYVCECLSKFKEQFYSVISNFSAGEKLGIVVDCYTPDSIKRTLKKSLKEKKIECVFYTYDDLNNKKLNNIQENKVLVLVFTIDEIRWRLDNGNVVKKSLIPNSFDGYKLSEGQELLEIVNEVTACDYQNHLNNYHRKLNYYTRSIYRNNVLNNYGIPIEKNDSIWSRLYNHNEYRDVEGNQQTVPSYRFEFDDNSKVSIPETDYVIYQKNKGENEFRIEKLREIASKEDLKNIYAIQSLSSLEDDTIDIFIRDKITQANNFENSLRKQYIKKGIIPDDDSYQNVPIWKFLLKKRMEEECLKRGIVTTDEIAKAKSVWNLLRNRIDDPQLLEIYKEISVSCSIRYIINKWCNIESETPITPGEGTNRTNLIENFLHMGKAVVSLYNQKQRLQRNNTRQSNEVKDKFLLAVLFKPVSESVEKEVMDNDNILDLLPIESKEDIEALKSCVEEKINLKPIISYAYVNN